MKVLMIYRWINHKRSMDTFATLLSERGYRTDVICLDKCDLDNNCHIKHLEWSYRVMMFLRCIDIPLVRRCCHVLSSFILKHQILAEYDRVVFHAYYSDFMPWMKYCHEHGIKYNIMLWGSDVLRSSENSIKRREYGFRYCEKICGVPIVTNRLTDVFGGKFQDKYVCTYLGNANIDLWKSWTINGNKTYGSYKIDNDGKFVVTCGYNASPAQQHIVMLNAIKSLPEELKQKIYVIVPMAYGGTPEYISEIETFLSTAGVSYHINRKFLESEELYGLRMQSNIVINTQITDFFAQSLQEYLYCSNVALIADWLQYPLYEKENVWYVKINRDNIKDKLEDVICHYDKYKTMAESNPPKICKVASWNSVIDKWIESLE